MKKFISVLFVLLCIIVGAASVSANDVGDLELLYSNMKAMGSVDKTIQKSDSIRVVVNNEEVGFDVLPSIINDRTLVPMRAIFERLDADVEWDGSKQEITANDEYNIVKMQIGSSTMTVNGKTVILDAPPMIIDGRTLVPVRAISESLGCEVDWDDITRTVVITGKIKYGDKYPTFTDVTKIPVKSEDSVRKNSWYYNNVSTSQIDTYINKLKEYGFLEVDTGESSSSGLSQRRRVENWKDFRETVTITYYTFDSSILLQVEKRGTWSGREIPDYSAVSGAEFQGVGFMGIKNYKYDCNQFMTYFNYLNSEGYRFSIEKSSDNLKIDIYFGGWKLETIYYNPKYNQIQIL